MSGKTIYLRPLNGRGAVYLFCFILVNESYWNFAKVSRYVLGRLLIRIKNSSNKNRLTANLLLSYNILDN